MTKRKCSVDGCGRPHKAHGFCKSHASRWRKYGGPLNGPTVIGAATKFVENALDHTSPECLIWPFATNGMGYGVVSVKGELRYAHRIVCERVHGPPPSSSHHVAHDNNGKPCESRACINPMHLRWATAKENCQDKADHGTSQIGEANPYAKLTAAQVEQIRALKGSAPQRVIAERFGVARETIRNIYTGLTWSVK